MNFFWKILLINPVEEEIRNLNTFLSIEKNWTDEGLPINKRADSDGLKDKFSQTGKEEITVTLPKIFQRWGSKNELLN